MQLYCIYKHTSPSGKSYIGQTKNYDARCSSHRNLKTNSTRFKTAIQKYGWDSFTHEILKSGLTLEEANHWETFYISFYNSLHPYGYNLNEGGDNKTASEITRKRMSDSLKGRIKSEQECKNISEGKKGIALTEEHKQKLKKPKAYSEDMKQHLSEVRSNRTLNEEIKIKISLGNAGDGDCCLVFNHAQSSDG